MYWFILILLSAVFISLADLSAKKSLYNVHSVQFQVIFKAFEILIMLFLVSRMNFSHPYWVYFMIFGIAFIGTAASLLSTKGIRHLEISTVAPLANISPFFLLIIAFFVLGETISRMQFFGITLLIFGVYFLESEDGSSAMANIRHILSSRYVLLVIFAYVLYSFTATGEKYLLDFINPETLMFLIIAFMGINFFIISFLMYGGYSDFATGLKSSGKYIALVALFAVAGQLFYVFALKAAFVSLVIPMKRLSTLFTTLLGGEFFHESGILKKASACVIMIVGIFLIAL